MEQAIHLKHTVQKLDHALERLQEIQRTLRDHSPSLGVADLDITLLHRPRLRRFDELGSGAAVDQSEEWRRWSTPAPLTHDALSEVATASRFAKKTVDMVKVQKKQAANTPRAKEPSLLQPSNRVNLLQPTMAAPDDASGGQPTRGICKENRRTPHQSKLDWKNAPELLTKAGSDKHRESTDKACAWSCAGVTAEEKHAMSSHIIRLRSLATEDAAARESHGTDDQTDPMDCIMQQHDDQDDNMHQDDPINHQHCREAAPTFKRSSSSMRALMQIKDEGRALSRRATMQDKGEDMESSLSSSLASQSFCVQLEEIKASRKKKSWGFSQGKASGNVVVMFPNPTYDEATPPASTPPYVKPTMDNSTVRQVSFQEKAATQPSIGVSTRKAPPPSTKKACPQKEKIVRLSPCSTASRARKPSLPPAPKSGIASASQGAPHKMQTWNPPPPTLIRRLPAEAHEMTQVQPDRGTSVLSSSSFSIGRVQNKKKGNHGERHIFTDDNDDDDDGSSMMMKRSWSFGNNSVIKSTPSSSNERRSSLGTKAGGGHAFSFLSRHFHAWRKASKEDP